MATSFPMAERIEPVFVERIPEDLEAGKLYLSIRFRTASHLCACGCGLKVVTPIKPAKWRLTYDGESVSLSPSIGRWQLPCKSHYCIVNNEIIWARSFSEREMASVQRRDVRDTRAYYQRRAEPERITPASDAHTSSSTAGDAEAGFWTRVGLWLRRGWPN